MRRRILSGDGRGLQNRLRVRESVPWVGSTPTRLRQKISQYLLVSSSGSSTNDRLDSIEYGSRGGAAGGDEAARAVWLG